MGRSRRSLDGAQQLRRLIEAYHSPQEFDATVFNRFQDRFFRVKVKSILFVIFPLFQLFII